MLDLTLGDALTTATVIVTVAASFFNLRSELRLVRKDVEHLRSGLHKVEGSQDSSERHIQKLHTRVAVLEDRTPVAPHKI